MKTLTLEKRFALGLLAFGFREIKPLTKYRVFTNASEGTKLHYKRDTTSGRIEPIAATWFYIGRNGALRISRDGKVSSAREASAKTRERILSNPNVPTHEHRGFLLREPCISF